MRFVRFFASLLVICFLLFAPAPLKKALDRDPMRELFETDPPDWYGVIEIWHIVEFRTYQGSVTNFLQDCCEAFSRTHPGIHFEVIGMTPTDYASRIARGLRPDAYSFPAGFLSETQLRDLVAEPPILRDGISSATADGRLFAAPYLMSGYFLLFNEQRALADGGTLPDSADMALLQSLLAAGELSAPADLPAALGLSGEAMDYAEFLLGKHTAAIADARSLGDLMRSTEQNLLVRALPLAGYTDQVLYLGADANTDEHRAACIGELYTYLLSESVQQKVTTLGAMPVRKYLDPVAYGSQLLEEWNKAYLLDTVTPYPLSP